MRACKGAGRYQVLFDDASRPEFGHVPREIRAGRGVSTELNGLRFRVGGSYTFGTSFAADGKLRMGEPAFHRAFPNRSPAKVSIGVIQVAPGAAGSVPGERSAD